MKNVSLKAIAAELGVSINTVSHALRDMSDISEELKSKVRKKAIELGYMPNRISQIMKKDESPVVAIILGSLTNLYFNILCSKLMSIFAEKDAYDVVLLLPWTAKREIDLIKQCILQRVDLVVTHQALQSETLELARLNNIQIIMIGSDTMQGVDTITVDEVMGCTLVARYLSLFESKKFIYVGIDYALSDYRYQIFESEIQRTVGGEVKYFNIEHENFNDLYKHIFNGYRQVFFYNDSIAYEALAKLDSYVVDIRKMYPDLHLVGFDGLCEEVVGLRQLTTVKIDFSEFAREAYLLIKNRLENPGIAPQKKVVPVTLHQRIQND